MKISRISHKSKTSEEGGVKLRFTDIPELTCQNGGRLADGLCLYRIGRVLSDCRTLDNYKQISPNAGTRRDPFSNVERPDMGSAGSLNDLNVDDDSWDQMQESMRQLLASNRAIASLELSEKDEHVSEPLLPLMKGILSDAKSPIPIHLVFGMEMLLSKYKAFLWPRGA